MREFKYATIMIQAGLHEASSFKYIRRRASSTSHGLAVVLDDTGDDLDDLANDDLDNLDDNYLVHSLKYRRSLAVSIKYW
jgi:hypothetical protein